MGPLSRGGDTAGGVVFKVKINGSGFTPIHYFDTYWTDGLNPNAGLVFSGGWLYGTDTGSSSTPGTVYSLNLDGAGYTRINDSLASPFRTPNGITLSGNTIYVADTYKGTSGYYGGIYKINTDGTGYTNLYSFTPESYNSSYGYTNYDGANPRGTLILSGNTLYGTTSAGGAYGYGTLFSVKTDGTGFTLLHSFAGGSTDGTVPAVNLALSGNTLYGTTPQGGIGFGNVGSGTIFKVNTDGSGYRVIYFFTSGNDGNYPNSGVIVSGSTLYGMADTGSAFSVNTDGTGFSTLVHIPSSLNTSMGYLFNSLILAGNTLYGTAQLSGSGTNGFVFSVTLPGTTLPPSLSILHQGNTAIISWPPGLTNWTLQTNNSLTTGTWLNYAGATVNNRVTNQLTRGNVFFRLTSP